MYVNSKMLVILSSASYKLSEGASSSLLFSIRVSHEYNVVNCSPLSFVCLCVCGGGLDHRAVWSHSAGSLRAEPVLHRAEAHRHRPVRSAPEGGEPQLG